MKQNKGQTAKSNTSQDDILQAVNQKQKQKLRVIKVSKERFDCVSLALKDTKVTLKARIDEAEVLIAKNAVLSQQLLESKVETALAQAGAKNLRAAKALIVFDALQLRDGEVEGVTQQIVELQASCDYLFESAEPTSYMLVPVHKGLQNKAISNRGRRQMTALS